MTSDQECFVHIVLPGETEFVPAGRFRLSASRSGAPVGRFVYGRTYLKRSNAVELDPVQLRLGAQPYETAQLKGFFGAIRDSMPDDWGRRVMEKRFGGVPLDDFHYLMDGPDDRSGALGFSDTVTPPKPARSFPDAVHLDELQAFADAIVAGEPASDAQAIAHAADLLSPETSMGGARPKIVVESAGELWLAKFAHRDDRWNHPRVEHGLLALAKACGIRVADSRVETIGSRDVLLVRRFDRQRADGGFFRHRMVSALTLLRSDSSEAGRQRWSYLLLADEVRRVSPAPKQDLSELFTRMCFNAAVSNSDDHPRNHALLAEGRTWRLSPAYDVMPMPSHATGHGSLAMACGPLGKMANKDNLIAGAGRFLLGEEEAEQIFQQVSERVRAQWEPTLRQCGVSERDCQAIAPAFLQTGLLDLLKDPDLPERMSRPGKASSTQPLANEPFGLSS